LKKLVSGIKIVQKVTIAGNLFEQPLLLSKTMGGKDRGPALPWHFRERKIYESEEQIFEQKVLNTSRLDMCKDVRLEKENAAILGQFWKDRPIFVRPYIVGHFSLAFNVACFNKVNTI